MPPGFAKIDLQARYGVRFPGEDGWHSYSDLKTKQLITDQLGTARIAPPLILNAGSGGHSLNQSKYQEVSVDLFPSQFVDRGNSVCASVTQLPFASSSFGLIVCVGEVLGYCDPASAIAELARVLSKSGTLICDFGSTTSFRYRFTKTFARAAEMTTDWYNGSTENIWIYSPEYIQALLSEHGFSIAAQFGTHYWSAVARRFGASPELSVVLERRLGWIRAPLSWADLRTIVAVRETNELK